MSESHAVLPGAEAWSVEGHGTRRRIGLLLVHGFTGNPISLRPLAELLHERGFSIELVRLPGHGTHFRDMARTRYPDWRGEVERALGALEARVERVVPVGFSMGGTLVLDVVSRQSARVAGVVTINALILDRAGVLPRLAPLIERVVPVVPAAAAGLVKNDINRPGGDESAYAWVSSRSGNSLLRELPRIRERLALMACPLLVLVSRQDHSVAPENSAEILLRAGSADKTQIVLERSYHVAPLDYDQPLIVQSIEAFADRVAGTG